VSVAVPRVAGRLLIIDPDGRVLLINEQLERGSAYWLVPGGGVEGGEHPRQAAAREALEETGLRLALDPDAPEVLRERRTWSYGATTYDQTNHFYAIRVAAGLPVVAHGLTALERDTFLGFQWWHPDEIDASGEVFYPAELAAVVRAVALSLSAGRGPQTTA
jgi:8-oxo-dGTP pyrophosphatase MutT (NUDIX family)